jgi:hypothetical protein
MIERLRSEESGAILVIVAVSMVVLLLAAGLVIDLGGVRTLRADHQRVADSAVSAAAVTASSTHNGEKVCETAKQYILANSAEISNLSGIDCTGFPQVCTASTAQYVGSTTVDGVTVRIAYPITDGSSFLDPSALGAPAQPVSALDGSSCDRVGVGMTSAWDATFARIAGFENFTADVGAVAKSELPVGGGVPINLLVLDRTGCQALHASGGGGIYVDAVPIEDMDGDPSNGLQSGLSQGIAASDSDGSSGCSTSDGVIDIDGTGAVLRADGPEGCANQTGTHTVGGFLAGEGCGEVSTLAPGTPGCNHPACTYGSTPPNPEPIALAERLTRAPVDHRYNCRMSYGSITADIAWATSALTVGNGQDIPGCEDAAGGTDYVHRLIRSVGASGTPSGFASWTANGLPCSIEGGPAMVLAVPAGDWHVDCPSFSIKRPVYFQGGNVIFDGGITITASGILAINATTSSPTVPATYTPVEPEGKFSKAGDGSFIALNTTVYTSEQVESFSLQGGNGALRWIAPNQGDFDDLALWSDSSVVHSWAGQAELSLEGVFFTPLADVEYAGTAGQNQIAAQFVANRLHARGSGVLRVAPALGRSVEFPVQPTSTLIR